MNPIKILCVLSLSLLSATAIAQPRMGNPEERAQRQTERMKTELELDEVQTKMVAAINLAAAEKRQKAFQEGGGDRQAMREVMMTLREETQAQLKEVLTDEQWTKWESLRADMGPRRGRGNRPGGPGAEDAPGKKKEKKKKKGSQPDG